MKPERLLKVVLATHVSEKSSIATEKRNEYVFEVEKTANKTEIKDAVKYLFNVDVEGVRIVNVKPKNKNFRNKAGVRQGWKKAYVTIKADQAIEVAGAQ